MIVGHVFQRSLYDTCHKGHALGRRVLQTGRDPGDTRDDPAVAPTALIARTWTTTRGYDGRSGSLRITDAVRLVLPEAAAEQVPHKGAVRVVAYFSGSQTTALLKPVFAVSSRRWVRSQRPQVRILPGAPFSATFCKFRARPRRSDHSIATLEDRAPTRAAALGSPARGTPPAARETSAGQSDRVRPGRRTGARVEDANRQTEMVHATQSSSQREVPFGPLGELGCTQR